jgi:hypothetical protein
MAKKNHLLVMTLVFSLAGCNNERDVMNAQLKKAVKDRKLSNEKIKVINDEFANLPDSLQEKYASSVIAIIKAGGDSTHVDVVRKRFSKR